MYEHIVDLPLRTWTQAEAVLRDDYVQERFPDLCFLQRHGLPADNFGPVAITPETRDQFGIIRSRLQRVSAGPVLKFARLGWTERDYRIDRGVIGLRFEFKVRAGVVPSHPLVACMGRGIIRFDCVA